MTAPSWRRSRRPGEVNAEPVVVNGAWCRWRRERAHVSVRTFADHWGLGVSRVLNIEANRVPCPPEILRAYRLLPRRQRAAGS